MHKVDPLAGQIGNSREVLGCRKPLRLEAAHLARRSRAPVRRVAADDPAHRRIMAQTFGVVHILVSGKATKYRLPQQTHQSMAAILARAGIGKNLARHRRQAECIVAFAVCNNPASDVTTEPRNWSISGRSKSNLRAPSSDSPAGFAIAA